jgi:hypothetical protein
VLPRVRSPPPSCGHGYGRLTGVSDSRKQLEDFEVELDRAVEDLAIARLPARSILVAAHLLLDALANGQRVPEIGAGDPGKAEAFAGRVFALEAVVRRASHELGADVQDNMDAFADIDPQLDQFKLLVAYGHFSEVMPEVRRGHYDVHGDRAQGFRLDHASPEFARYETRDTLLGHLVQPTSPARPALHTLSFDPLATCAPDLSSVRTIAQQTLATLHEHYLHELHERQLLPTDSYADIFGATRDEWRRFRAALWAFADFAYGIGQALFAQYHRREIEAPRLWEAMEWLSICWRADALVAHISDVARLDRRIVEQLLRPFTLDLRTGCEAGVAGDGYFPPVVRIEDAIITSPEFLRFFSLERNVLYVMNRRQPDVFSTVVADRLEPQLLAEARAIFTSIGDFEVVTNRSWTVEGKRGEVDLLLFSPSQNAAAHVQAKAPLAPQGARMIRRVEARAEEGLSQLRRLRELPDPARDAVLSQILGRRVHDVSISDVLLSRSHFGTARFWAKAKDVACINLGLLQMLVNEAREATGGLVLKDLPVRARTMLDDFVREAGTAWEHETIDLVQTTVEVPMLQYDRGVSARWQTSALEYDRDHRRHGDP